MPLKYPGGYQIIDLGDLSLITNNNTDTLNIPGIRERILTSNKPVILTGHGLINGSYAPEEMVNMTMFFRDSDPAFGVWTHNPVDGSVTGGWMIYFDEDDNVLFYEI